MDFIRTRSARYLHLHEPASEPAPRSGQRVLPLVAERAQLARGHSDWRSRLKKLMDAKIECVPLETRSESMGLRSVGSAMAMCSSLGVPLVLCGRANKSAAEAADLSALLRSELQMCRELHGASSVRGGVDLLVPRAEGVGLTCTLTLAGT